MEVNGSKIEQSADLTYANLSNAKLRYAHLFNANLQGANLANTNFILATMPDGTIHN